MQGEAANTDVLEPGGEQNGVSSARPLLAFGSQRQADQGDIEHAESDSPLGFDPPPLVGRHVQLRAITTDDYRFLQLVETSSEIGVRWRFRGTTPSPEGWAQSSGASSLAQFMVIKRVDRTPLGLVVAYQANFQDGYAYVAAAKFEPKQKSPLMILGIVMFINYVFSCWNFRKLYMEVPEYNLPQFSSRIDRYFTVEGTLREHIYSVGRYWDQFILSVDRSTWQERGQLLTQMALKES